MIVLAKRAGLPSAAVGGLVAVTGAATLLGSLASPLLRRVLPMRSILLGEYWAALGYIAFLLWPNVFVLAAAFAAHAFWFPNSDSAVAAYSYALIPDRLIGRALSVSNTLRVLAAPLGPLAAGLLLSSVSPRVTITVLAERRSWWPRWGREAKRSVRSRRSQSRTVVAMTVPRFGGSGGSDRVGRTPKTTKERPAAPSCQAPAGERASSQPPSKRPVPRRAAAAEGSRGRTEVLRTGGDAKSSPPGRSG